MGRSTKLERFVDVILVGAVLAMFLLLIGGCAADGGGGLWSLFRPKPQTQTFGQAVGNLWTAEGAERALTPMLFCSVPLILGGAVALFATSGRRGWTPLFIGVGLSVVVYVLMTLKAAILFIIGPIIITVSVIFCWQYVKKLRSHNGGLVPHWMKRKKSPARAAKKRTRKKARRRRAQGATA